MLRLPCTLPHKILTIIIVILLHSAMPAEAVPPAPAPTPSPTSSSSSANNMAVMQAQAQSLIAFKEGITHDPSSCLSSWITTSTSTSTSYNSTTHVAALPSYCPSNGTGGWFGLLCDDRFLVTSLNLSYCNLSGSISPSLALLPSLSLLDLSNNSFSGPLLFFFSTQPPNSSLTYLDLSYNAFLSGDIPRSLVLNSPNLQTLRLIGTRLSGLVPPEIWTHLPALRHLYISDTSSPPLLSISPTSFPPTANFPFCATIEAFSLDGLGSSGASFPSSLGDCQQLQYLVLSTTGLQGSIPPSIWELPHLQTLVIQDLNVLNAANNDPHDPRLYKLHGSLPSTFGFCGAAGSTIQNMYIDGVNLTGHIPASIGTCASLQNLDLSYTSLEGPIPSSLGNLTQLQSLTLCTTGLQGSIPQSIWQLPELQTLVIQDINVINTVNDYSDQSPTYTLHGSLPSAFGFCSAAGSTIKHISIDGINLTGHFPASIGTCATLQKLKLSVTNLEGSIPSSLGSLTQLQTLVLSTTGLQGSIPPAIWQLPHLQYLAITDLNVVGAVNNDPHGPRSYKLHGSLPSTFGFCSAAGSIIQNMYIRGINLTGNIPASIGTCASLQYLGLSHTTLEGTIPSSLGNLTQLQSLVLSTTGLQGSIPPSIWQLPYLQTLAIQDFNVVDTVYNHPYDPRPSKLHGSLPSTFGFCSAAGSTIEVMYIVGVNLTGHIPASIGTCASLQNLDLSYTNLQGIVPVDALHNLTALQKLHLIRNNLTGKIENLDLSKLPNLDTFNVYGNSLEGGLPAGLTESKALLFFNVQGNKYLTGSLGNATTPDISGLSNLRVLCVSYNQLSGDIPGWVWKLPNLQALDLSNNRFSGRFPATLTHLSYFRLDRAADSNQATLYEELLVMLKNTVQILDYVQSGWIYLDVSMNDLEGEIPESFGELQGLTGANLSHNRISGTIAEGTFGRLMELEELDLSYNQLRGGIPQDLTSLGSLSNLNLAHNQLEGPIPTGNNFNTRFTSVSFEDNPGLCGYPLSSSCNTSNSSHVGGTTSTGRHTQQLIVIWFNEVVSPWAVLMAYPVGLALGFLACRTTNL